MVAIVLKRLDGTQYWVIHQVVMELRAVFFAINFIQLQIRLFIIQQEYRENVSNKDA